MQPKSKITQIPNANEKFEKNVSISLTLAWEYPRYYKKKKTKKQAGCIIGSSVNEIGRFEITITSKIHLIRKEVQNYYS